MALDLSRRKFFLGLLAAPAIVKISSIMPVKAAPLILDGEGVRLHWRMLDAKYMEEMNQKVVQSFLYGNPEFSPVQFTGFKPARAWGPRKHDKPLSMTLPGMTP